MRRRPALGRHGVLQHAQLLDPRVGHDICARREELAHLDPQPLELEHVSTDERRHPLVHVIPHVLGRLGRFASGLEGLGLRLGVLVLPAHVEGEREHPPRPPRQAEHANPRRHETRQHQRELGERRRHQVLVVQHGDADPACALVTNNDHARPTVVERAAGRGRHQHVSTGLWILGPASTALSLAAIAEAEHRRRAKAIPRKARWHSRAAARAAADARRRQNRARTRRSANLPRKSGTSWCRPPPSRTAAAGAAASTQMQPIAANPPSAVLPSALTKPVL